MMDLKKKHYEGPHHIMLCKVLVYTTNESKRHPSGDTGQQQYRVALERQTKQQGSTSGSVRVTIKLSQCKYASTQIR